MSGLAALQIVPLAALHANPNQPRKTFDVEDLAALAESIAQVGLLQPILARPSGGGRFQIVAGERRARAARLAGLTEVPVLVWDADERQAFLLAVVENTSRADLDPLEEAGAYRVLEDDLGLTHEEIADRVGKSRAHVGNTMRLLNLPTNVQRFLREGLISAGHARCLLGVSDPFAAYLLAKRVSDEGLSVRAVEQIVRENRYPGGRGPRSGLNDVDRPAAQPTAARRADLADLEDWAETQVVDTRPHSGTPGSISFRYADDADRARLLGLLGASARSALDGREVSGY